MDIRSQYEAKKAADGRRAEDKQKTPWWWLSQRDPIARFTKWLALYTFILAVVTIGSMLVLLKTDQTLQDTMISNERPWLRVEITPDSDFAYDPEVGITFTTKIDISNIGKTPAVYVFVKSDLKPVSLTGQEIQSYERDICKYTEGAVTAGVGYMIFPNDHFVTSGSFLIFQKDAAKFFPDGFPDPKVPKKKIANIVVLTCVSYGDPLDRDRIHQTGVMARLGRAVWFAPKLSTDFGEIIGDSIPLKDIRVNQAMSFIGEYAK